MGRAVTITSLPFTISASGHYELTGDLTANGTDGIVVSAPNVVINLNGFSLNGTNNAGTAVAAINATNVTVHGGTISGFSAGADFSTNSKAQNLRIFNCGVAVKIFGNDCLVQDCFVIGLGANAFPYFGILIQDASNVQVTGCHLSQCFDGVRCTSSATGNAILHNYIASCTTGLELTSKDYYQGNIVTNCTTAFSGGKLSGERMAVIRSKAA